MNGRVSKQLRRHAILLAQQNKQHNVSPRRIYKVLKKEYTKGNIQFK